MQRLRMLPIVFFIAFLMAFFVETVAASGDSSDSFDISHLYPLGGALLVAGLM
ncbi:MAG TPA: hypothetical protein HA322_01145, partial [Candidatus Poseidoniaceae archaeon]|nr:hypothetical protein [Candidatus Poseidoniaceae archaeon]